MHFCFEEHDMNRRAHASLGFAFVLLAGCGGGGGSGSPPVPPQGPPPGQSAPLVLSTPSLSIDALGATQQLTASESGYAGFFNVYLGSCAPTVSVDATSLSGPQATFTFKGTALGSCTATISDTAGQASHILITVTSTTGSLQ